MEYEKLTEGILKKLSPLHPLVLLKKAIADDNIHSHAFLIYGNMWEGQMYFAKYLALMAIRMDMPEIHTMEQYVDLHLLTDTGERISIDEAKSLRTKLTQSARGRRHIVIIENIERLNSHNFSNEAANSLLKILEEPPVETLFLMTTSSIYEVLPTIISRVQTLPCSIPDDIYTTEPEIPNVGNKIELAMYLKDETARKEWNESMEKVQQLFEKKISVTEKALLLNFLISSSKDKEEEETVFSKKNIFFFQMELAIEERFKMSTIDKDMFFELQNMYKHLMQLKKDFASFINKKLAVEHFLISSFPFSSL